jgi:DNA-binding response OmpR family regulator
VEIVRTDDEALARLAGLAPSVVVLDLELPRVSGEGILHQSRSERRVSCAISLLRRFLMLKSRPNQFSLESRILDKEDNR